MPTLVGADGCRYGWFCIFEEWPSRKISSQAFKTIAELIAYAPKFSLLAIDIPIGLSNIGERECDDEARHRLGPIRGRSVFTAPVRQVLETNSHPEASKVSSEICEKKISIQTWGICKKIHEVDILLQTTPHLRDRVYEVHPEVTFSEWNHGTPILEPKKNREGFAKRHALIANDFGPNAYETIRARYKRKDVAKDDILDAFAALWTAERIQRGEALTLPTAPRIDAEGLSMRIFY